MKVNKEEEEADNNKKEIELNEINPEIKESSI